MGKARLLVMLLLATLLADARTAPAPVGTLPLVVPATHRPYRERLPGTKLDLDMVAVPGGEFLLGSPDREKGRPDEGPRRRVAVRAFWMGRVEVTWDLYDRFRKAPGVPERENEKALERDADAVTRPTPSYIDETRGFGHEGYPAIGMSHHAAMEFCRWLSKVTKKSYRLPLEAEWEWACRAGTHTAYGFGDDPAKLGDYAWYAANSGDSTHPVSKKKPNAWGLHDMHGNVAEWCLDHYQREGYPPTGRRPFALELLPTAQRYSHVARGGSWFDDPPLCRSAARLGSDPRWNRSDPHRPQSIWWLCEADFVGFRVVRAVEEYPELKGLRSKVTKRSK
jgi:formylglycine-generating enzyme required for sulfatase activity